MARFNTKTKIAGKTENYAGGEAFKETPELKLVSILLTSFVQDQYYRSSEDTLEELKSAIAECDKEFVAKAAVYARAQFGMRSISHVTAAELAHFISGKPWAKNFYDQIIYRVDDMSEILAYYYTKNGKALPRAMVKGFAKAFDKFNAYQLAKYRGEGNEVSLVDVVNLVHPRPTDGNEKALKDLIAGTLRSTETWESKLTIAGQEAKDEEDKEKLKKKVWVDLIKNKKIGYFALLRNLRNIAEQAPEIVDEACELLTDENLIKKSLVLPFRFMTATRQLQEDGVKSAAIYRAINEALEISFANVPKFKGKTLVVVDHSGSMDSVEHGNLSNFEIGALFGVALAKTNDADFMYFGDTAKYAGINPVDSTPTIVEKLAGLNDGGSTDVGHGTNFHAIFEEASGAYNRIVIFSDMQGWVGYDAPTSTFSEYKKRTSANPFIYSFDLAGYGSLQFPEGNTFCLAGFSEKIFTIMKLLEEDRHALVKKIEATTL